jgi:hypothetical protein
MHLSSMAMIVMAMTMVAMAMTMVAMAMTMVAMAMTMVAMSTMVFIIVIAWLAIRIDIARIVIVL